MPRISGADGGTTPAGPLVCMLRATGAGQNGAARHAGPRQLFRGLAAAGFAAAVLLLWSSGPVWCDKAPYHSTAERSGSTQDTSFLELGSGGFAA